MTLDDIFCWITDTLGKTPQSADSPFKTMTLSTVDKSGHPQARVVVMREFSDADKRITFYTDYRAQKIRDIQSNPKIALTFYDPAEQVQLRCCANTQINYQNPAAKTSWDKTSRYNKLSYATSENPGAQLEQPFANTNGMVDASLTYQNFAAVYCQLTSLEYLKLNNDGHLRARFVPNPINPCGWSGHWLVP